MTLIRPIAPHTHWLTATGVEKRPPALHTRWLTATAVNQCPQAHIGPAPSPPHSSTPTGIVRPLRHPSHPLGSPTPTHTGSLPLLLDVQKRVEAEGDISLLWCAANGEEPLNLQSEACRSRSFGSQVQQVPRFKQAMLDQAMGPASLALSPLHGEPSDRTAAGGMSGGGSARVTGPALEPASARSGAMWNGRAQPVAGQPWGWVARREAHPCADGAPERAPRHGQPQQQAKS